MGILANVRRRRLTKIDATRRAAEDKARARGASAAEIAEAGEEAARRRRRRILLGGS